MNLNLGKILIGIALLPIMVWAEVSAKLSQSIIYRGDEVRLTLSAEGDRVVFPDIIEIDGFPILRTSNRESSLTINNKMTQNYSRIYSFMPTKDVVIPTYTIEVDGQSEVTAPLTLRVAKPTASGTDSVQFVMDVDKNSSYVGEPITLNLTFKSQPNVRYDKVELSEPKFKKFWVKKINGLKQGQEGNYLTQTYSYVLFPQEEGNFTLDAPFVKLGKREAGVGVFNDPFFGNLSVRINWRKLFANKVTLNIKPLPNNLEVYGDYSITAHVDKREVKANKPVNLTLEVKGQGNIEDIKKFELDIEDAVVYSDELKVYNSGVTKGVVSQKIAIVADRNFTIPSVSFSYFDKKSQREKTIKTKPIAITVTGKAVQNITSKGMEQKVEPKTLEVLPTEKQEEKSSQNISSNEPSNRSLWFVFGLLSGILLTVLSWFINKKFKGGFQRKEFSFSKKIRRAKTDKELFELLLPYRHDGVIVKDVLEKLERNIYASGKETINREDLIEFFEEELSL